MPRVGKTVSRLGKSLPNKTIPLFGCTISAHRYFVVNNFALSDALGGNLRLST
jgi:hypothetical protein